jgi:hypothetical protein
MSSFVIPAMDNHQCLAETVSAARLRHLLAVEGGFTVSLDTGLAIRDGISLCVAPRRSLAVAAAHWNDHTVEQWLDRQRTSRHASRTLIGGWHDHRRDIMWLDVVRVVPRRLRIGAFVAGRLHRQHSVFDLTDRRIIRLDRGATVRTTVSLPFRTIDCPIDVASRTV